MQPRPIDPLQFDEPTPTSDLQSVTPVAPEPARDPVSATGWRERLRHSPWFPILGKGAAVTAVMLGFSALGAVSMATTEPGVQVAAQLSPLSPVEWLAPTPATASASAPLVAARTPPEHSVAHATPAASAAPLGIRPACSEPGSLCDQQKKPSEGLTRDGKVILNVASAEVLTQLPGVGARRAEAIVELRQRLKRFRKPSDLLRVRGIGVRSLKRMLPHLVLDAPKPDAPAGAPTTPPGKPRPP
ncbi:MAG TPA: helix-hairpin-helix domain-containing protein [Polyangiaceae bacterium]